MGLEILKKYKDLLNTKIFVLLSIFLLSVFGFYHINSVLKIIKYIYKTGKEITVYDIYVASYLTDLKLDNDIVFVIRVALPVILILFYFSWYFETLFFSENRYMFVLRYKSVEKLSRYYIKQVINLSILSFFIYYFWCIPIILNKGNYFSGILDLIKIDKMELNRNILLMMIFQFMLSTLNTIILVLVQNILSCYKKIRDKSISISLFLVIFVHLSSRKTMLPNLMFVESFSKINERFVVNMNTYLMFLFFLSCLLYLRMIKNIANNMEGE